MVTILCYSFWGLDHIIGENMTVIETIKFEVPSAGYVSALLQRPRDSSALYVLGHGSGSIMTVPFMTNLANALAAMNVATLRFEFPYSEQADFVPYSDMPTDSDEVLIATVRAALKCGAGCIPNIPIFVGGHSVSAYVTTIADAEARLLASGIISLAFPNKGEPSRSAHFVKTSLPILFIQGTNDSLGTVVELDNIVATLGNTATLKWIEGASHGFKAEERNDEDVVDEIATLISDYT